MPVIKDARENEVKKKVGYRDYPMPWTRADKKLSKKKSPEEDGNTGQLSPKYLVASAGRILSLNKQRLLKSVHLQQMLRYYNRI